MAQFKDSTKQSSINRRKGGFNKKSRTNSKQNSNCNKNYEEDQNIYRNHPEWYNNNAALVSTAANYSFNYATGLGIDMSTSSQGSTYFKSYHIPGIMKLRYAPVAGVSNDGNSPINVCARNIYSWVRHANSGSSVYDPADLMLYLFSMSSIYEFHSWMKRIYGLMRAYMPRNRYIPKAILEAIGIVNPDQFMKYMPDLLYYINTYAAKAGSLTVPASITYPLRHMWMNENVFMDTMSPKGQFYLFEPAAFYVYTEKTDDGLGYAKFQKRPSVINDIDDITAFGDKLINAMILSEDCGIMSGDIRKAYSSYFTLNAISPDYITIPGFAESTLSQIQNATLIGSATISDLTQTPQGALIQTIKTTEQDIAGYACANRLVSMFKEDPSPDDVMVATRLTAIGEYAGDTITYTTAGSDVLLTADLYKYSPDGELANNRVESIDHIINLADALNATKKLETISDFAAFNFHPSIFVWTTEDNATFKEAGPLFQTDNSALFTKTDLSRLNEVALMSMFNIKS